MTAPRTKDRVHIPGRPQVTQKTRQLNEEPDKVMLSKLRVLEKKMGLVLTLVRPLNPACVRAIPADQAYTISSKPPCGVLSTSSQSRRRTAGDTTTLMI